MKFKKALAILLAIMCLSLTVIAPVNAAETNHCGEFKEFISLLYLQGITSGDTAQSVNGISVFKICEYTFFKEFNKPEYSVNGDDMLHSVDYATFKAAASKYFDLSSVSAKFDSIVKSENCYDAATDKITISGGGYGDSAHYEIYGYSSQSNNIYTVYGYGVDYYFDDEGLAKAPAGAVKGRDYITVTDDGGASNDLEILATYKIGIRKNGSILQFISCEKISSVPSEGIIKPGDTVKSESETSSPKTDSKKTESNSDAPSFNAKAEETKTEEKPDDNKAEVKTDIEEDCGITSIDKSAFAEGTVVKASKITDKSDIKKINTALIQKADIKRITVFEFTADSADGSAVQPDKAVKVTFQIPEGYNPKNIAVYYVSDDRKQAEEIEAEIDEDKNTLTALLHHFSTYVIAEKVAAEDAVTVAEKDGGNNALIIVTVAVLLAALIAVVIVLLVLKKKKPIHEDIELIEQSEPEISENPNDAEE